MATSSNHYVLILCGGTGPRLWPLSRASRPKQFLKLFGSQSLLQETFTRYQEITPSTHIFVVTQAKYRPQVTKELPQLPPSHILTEPCKKNTAMAIIYGSSVIYHLNPQAIITTAPADHFISGPFAKDIAQAVKTASSTDTLVTIGIKPVSPNPAFGYILPNFKFIEKPTVIDAQLYIKRGAKWNSGIYTFSLTTLSQELKSTQPKYYSLYQKLIKSPRLLPSIYQQSPNLSFDVAISEKSSRLSLIPCHFRWSDIGDWRAIYQQLPLKDSFAVLDKSTNFIQFNSRKCLINGQKDKLIGLVGVNNLAIIDTPNALLICNIAYNDSYNVRDLVGTITKSPKLKKFFLK